MKRALHFPIKLNSRDTKKCNCFEYPPMICSPLLESSISHAHSDRREKHVVFSVRSNLPSKCSTCPVLSEPKFGPTPLPPNQKWLGSLSTFTLTIIHLIYPPPPPQKKSIIFKFSWEDCKSQDKLETMLMQNFWGVTKVYCGNVKAANLPLLSAFDPWEMRYSEVLGWGLRV